MIELIVANWFTFLVAFLIGVATAWWVWARYGITADVAAPKVAAPVPKVEAPAPKIAAEPVKAVPVAAAPVPLMDTAKAKAKAAAKAKPAPKAKVEAPKVKAASVPKPKAAAPKAKVAAAPKAKVAAAPRAAPVAKPKAAPAPKPKVVAKPKTAAKPKPAPKPIIPDNLELLKGVGPKLNTLLKSLGVTSFEQVANWTPAEIREIDSKLGNFAGRIGRDNWIDQAKLLVAGDIANFEKKYGSLGSEIQKG